MEEWVEKLNRIDAAALQRRSERFKRFRERVHKERLLEEVEKIERERNLVSQASSKDTR